MIPYGRQEVTKEDIKSVIEVLESDFLTQGPAVPQFEKKISKLTSVKYSVAVNSATSGLHIACLALGLGPGDILWTSAITFVASANCALHCGAKVDFIDVDPDTALMSIDHLRLKLIEAKKSGTIPKIVIPVHFAGQPCDMKEIFKLGQDYGFKIIEDAAHAIGAKYNDMAIGNCKYSDIAVFSFHPVKIITTGEGGICLTNNVDLSNIMRRLRSHGITRKSEEMTNSKMDSWYYEQIDLGLNYRMTDIQAALGISQLKRLDDYIAKRLEISLWYDSIFLNMKVKPLIKKKDRYSSNHLYVVRIPGSMVLRDNLFRSLRKANIGVNLHYIPLYHHPYFKSNIRLSGAEEYYNSAISLPIFPTISKKELMYVVDQISNFI
jgi:UDP-4-amino-4,6-dideoxy-N-acetyl-beta-L-altrosamine transaminase